jgi:predicted anti-sigma-YlaC factor YlaD
MKKHEECRKQLEQLSDYLDGTAQEKICEEIEAHLKSCPDCRIMVDTMRKSILLYREGEERLTMPVEVRDRLYRRLELDDLLTQPPRPSE